MAITGPQIPEVVTRETNRAIGNAGRVALQISDLRTSLANVTRRNSDLQAENRRLQIALKAQFKLLSKKQVAP
jgi:regulator of replication initiation timing